LEEWRIIEGVIGIYGYYEGLVRECRIIRVIIGIYGWFGRFLKE